MEELSPRLILNKISIHWSNKTMKDFLSYFCSWPTWMTLFQSKMSGIKYSVLSESLISILIEFLIWLLNLSFSILNTKFMPKSLKNSKANPYHWFCQINWQKFQRKNQRHWSLPDISKILLTQHKNKFIENMVIFRTHLWPN